MPITVHNRGRAVSESSRKLMELKLLHPLLGNEHFLFIILLV
ncbi:unnamed protein product [Musa acuminata subsp. burmannicoides]